MPPRSVKMKRLHLRVPAARLVAEMDAGLQELSHADDGMGAFLSLGLWIVRRREPGGTGAHDAGTATRPIPPGRGLKKLGNCSRSLRFGRPRRRSIIGHGEHARIRSCARGAGRRDPRPPPGTWRSRSSRRACATTRSRRSQRLGRLGQLGDMPTFIGELARELVDPQPERLRRGSPLAAQAREHARAARGARLLAARDRHRVPAPAARAVALRLRALRRSSAAAGRARRGAAPERRRSTGSSPSASSPTSTARPRSSPTRRGTTS